MKGFLHDTPLGVKIVTILYYIGAVLIMLIGLLSIFGVGRIGYLAPVVPLLASISAGAVTAIGILLVALGVFFWIVARRFSRRHQWARVTIVVVSLLMIVQNIAWAITGGVVSVLLPLIIHGIIVCYLVFSDEVRDFFKHQ